MIQKLKWAGITTSLGLFAALPVYSQVIGSYDNFDCFNDTGEVAEGFEIDVEDVASTDLIREFPSNFSTTPWVIRYGLPTVKSYDYSTSRPDPEHAYDAGHKGVLITWAATWSGSQWVAPYGDQPFGATVAGNGTPYVANPTYTNGDSCWYYGLGNEYPSSGCDHFGISFAAGVSPGKLTYHWKIPDPSNPGHLINAGSEASLPPSPVLTVNPPVAGQPPVVHAVAEAPENPEPQFGPAYWVKTTTFYGKQAAQLDDLQKGNVKLAKTWKVVSWNLLQRPPAGEAGERDEVENHKIPRNYVQVTKQYEYWAYAGAYDSETNEVDCDGAYYGTEANLLAETRPVQTGCQNLAGNPKPYTRSYWTLDPATNVPEFIAGGNLGKYLGAHINAVNVQ